MHIAIDARELTGRPTGPGRYLAQLLAHWDRMPEARCHRYSLVAHGPVAGPVAADIATLDLTILIRPGAGGTRWEQATLPAALRQLSPDVLFAPAYTAPLLAPTPLALAVHDVSFAAHPEWFQRRDAWRRTLVTKAAARRARVVLTLSAFSRSEIVRYLGLSDERVRVIPLGLGLPSIDGSASPRERTGPPHVLFAGSIFNRRHVPALIRAMAHVRARHPRARLTIVGENRTWPHQDLAAVAAQAGVADAVTEAAYVSDDRLRSLYDDASVFAFLSEYEGFGLTPLEALAHGLPTLVLDTPVAREIYRDAVEYVATTDPEAIAAALVRLHDEPGSRLVHRARVDSLLARYSWDDTARATLRAIEEAGHR